MQIEDDPEYEELLAQRLFESQYRNRLFHSPNCRDPDHPGCEKCEEVQDDAHGIGEKK